jgi:hypothetical protein
MADDFFSGFNVDEWKCSACLAINLGNFRTTCHVCQSPRVSKSKKVDEEGEASDFSSFETRSSKIFEGELFSKDVETAMNFADTYTAGRVSDGLFKDEAVEGFSARSSSSTYTQVFSLPVAQEEEQTHFDVRSDEKPVQQTVVQKGRIRF